MVQLRSDPKYAGEKCAFKTAAYTCNMYARYAVGYTEDRGTAEDIGTRLRVYDISCGQHLPIRIREVWQKKKQAPVIQEIPGMWRDKPSSTTS